MENPHLQGKLLVHSLFLVEASEPTKKHVLLYGKFTSTFFYFEHRFLPTNLIVLKIQIFLIQDGKVHTDHLVSNSLSEKRGLGWLIYSDKNVFFLSPGLGLFNAPSSDSASIILVFGPMEKFDDKLKMLLLRNGKQLLCFQKHVLLGSVTNWVFFIVISRLPKFICSICSGGSVRAIWLCFLLVLINHSSLASIYFIDFTNVDVSLSKISDLYEKAVIGIWVMCFIMYFITCYFRSLGYLLVCILNQARMSMHFHAIRGDHINS